MFGRKVLGKLPIRINNSIMKLKSRKRDPTAVKVGKHIFVCLLKKKKKEGKGKR